MPSRPHPSVCSALLLRQQDRNAIGFEVRPVWVHSQPGPFPMADTGNVLAALSHNFFSEDGDGVMVPIQCLASCLCEAQLGRPIGLLDPGRTRDRQHPWLPQWDSSTKETIQSLGNQDPFSETAQVQGNETHKQVWGRPWLQNPKSPIRVSVSCDSRALLPRFLPGTGQFQEALQSWDHRALVAQQTCTWTLSQSSIPGAGGWRTPLIAVS